MSIFDKQQDLENVPDQALIQLGQQPDPQYPSYLVMAEVERRRDMRQRHEAEMAKHQAANPPDIATQRMDELGGIAGVDPAMGQGPPPEDMAALQGGIAGGPPPGMEQMGGPPPDMGGPPPGMEGQPPMMAYGGLIPGYRHGGPHPDPDQDLYSENLPGTEDYEREGLFGGLWDAASRNAAASNARYERVGELMGKPFESLTPEEQDEMRDFSTSLLGVGSVRNVGKEALAKVIPAATAGASRVAGRVAGRLPGAARRSAAELLEAATARVANLPKGAPAADKHAADEALRLATTAASDFASGLERLRPSWLRPGSRTVQGLERQVEHANTVAREAAEAAVGAHPQSNFVKLAKTTADEAAAAAKALAEAGGTVATPGRLRRGAGTVAGLVNPIRHPVIAGGAALGSAAYMGGDEPGGDPWFDKPERSGAQILTEHMGEGLADVGAFGLRQFDRFSPFDTPGGDWARGRGGDDDDEDVVSGGTSAYDAWKANQDAQAASDDVTADELADVGAGRSSTGEIAGARRVEIEDARTRANTLSQDEKDLSQLRKDEATRETELLARELGLSTERVAELRGEMRTEKETDHARKARLFSGLGAALMGSPRGLGSALQGTTTGLEDLDEELRVERRRDLGDVHEQRAKGIDIERSGRRGIASLKASDLEMLIDRARAGDADAQAALTSLTGQEMQAASAYDQMAMQIRRAANDRDLANMPSYVEFEEMANDEQRAVALRTDLSPEDIAAIIAGIDGAISAFRNQNMDLAVRRMDSALGRR